MIMNANGLMAAIHTPNALTGDSLHRLPPHAIRPAYLVDEYPACPSSWMHGSAVASSYFVPVESGRGMWFDFTMNMGRDNELAVVVSVQGVNPLTGPIKKGEVAELRLEQYKNKCPRHDCEFMQDRFCPQCKYKWPAQNYLASTTKQMMWIDGFRNEDGEVRQYIVTEDDAKGVASQMLGDKRVFAIGFAFYESTQPKPQAQVNHNHYHYDYGWYYSPYVSYLVPPAHFGDEAAYRISQPKWALNPPRESASYTCSASDEVAGALDFDGAELNSMGFAGGPVFAGPGPIVSGGGGTMSSSNAITPQSMGVPISTNNMAVPMQTSGRGMSSGAKMLRAKGIMQPAAPAKVLEIGAGSRICQEHGVDPNDIDYWKSEPTGMIYVNYTTQAECDRILAAGKREDEKDGAFSGVKLAN